jgi:hypothetical protein
VNLKILNICNSATEKIRKNLWNNIYLLSMELPDIHKVLLLMFRLLIIAETRRKVGKGNEVRCD